MDGSGGNWLLGLIIIVLFEMGCSGEGGCGWRVGVCLFVCYALSSGFTSQFGRRWSVYREDVIHWLTVPEKWHRASDIAQYIVVAYRIWDWREIHLAGCY